MSSREHPAVGFNHLSRGTVVFAHGPKESAFRSAADIELSADVSSTGRSCDRRSVANRASLRFESGQTKAERRREIGGQLS